MVAKASQREVGGLGTGIDPVRFEVVRNGLLAITEEMGATLRRAAYSTNIKTRGDFSCAFFDRDCRAVAQAFAQPSHLGSLAHIVPKAVAQYGKENLQPGDMLLTNDPFTGGVHLNDISLITPVFHQGLIYGFMANIAHHVDVGGGAPGSIGVSSEIYQEGLVIPPVRFVRDGQIDPNVFNIIRANFRGVHEISGDFRAQTAANRLGARRIQELLERYGAEELYRYIDGLLDYTERRVRAEFATFPDGEWSAESAMDGDGVRDEAIPLKLKVRIRRGTVTVDLTGCADQRPSPTNATFSQTYSGVVYVLKCLVDPDIPVNDGVYRLVDIRTRPGSLVHAQHPAAVAAGWEVAVQICDLLFKALAPAMPEKALACGKGIICNLAFGGTDPRNGRYFTYYETIAGGYGATTRNDGMDAVQAHFQNTENAPVEETEFHYPVRILRYELIDDSEGAGEHRGGMGVRRDYAFPGFAPSYSILSDRAKFPPWGLFGGGSGRAAHYQLRRKGRVTELPSKITFPTEPGDVVSVQTPGAGGVGHPWKRDPALVAEDVAQQRVSVARARAVYGVALHPRTFAVDLAKTAALRKRLRGKRSVGKVRRAGTRPARPAPKRQRIGRRP